MNDQQAQLDNLDAIISNIKSAVDSLRNSASIPRDIETAFRERLGIDSLSGTTTVVEGFKVGDVKIILQTSVPSGWQACTGGAISRTTFASLFAVIGTTWGAGDGSTTFNVPNFNGLFLAQYGANGVTAIGTTGGEQNHTLTNAELPVGVRIDSANFGATFGGSGSPSVSATVNGNAHNNMPPFAGVLFIIKT